jgi:hypothetical protein
MSQPGGERITQTITKRSISPIGPGQTLRSNALAKNNRNNNVLDSTAITDYSGPAYSIWQIFLFQFYLMHFFVKKYCGVFMQGCGATKYPCSRGEKIF